MVGLRGVEVLESKGIELKPLYFRVLAIVLYWEPI
jgi:hypothetical protein